MRCEFILLLALVGNAAEAQLASSDAASAPVAQTTATNEQPLAPGRASVSSNPLSAPLKASTTPALSADEFSLASNVDSILDTSEKVLKVIAYLVGATWVYFNYFQGRTYKPRLEVKLSGVNLDPKHPNLAKITAQVKNVGLSKCELLDKGTGLRLQGYDATKKVDHWIQLGTYSILTKNNRWIEPGVTIEEQLLLPIDPGTYATFRVELILNSGSVRSKTAVIF